MNATRIVVSSLGTIAALAGAEHGVGEIRQGSVNPGSIWIESWPDTEAFEILSGEPAMTLIPNLAVTGVVAIVVSALLGIWAIRYIGHRRGPLVLAILSLLLMLVGGGFGPPLIGMISAVGARSIRRPRSEPVGALRTSLAAIWPVLLAITVASYFSLVPGLVLASHWTGFESSGLTALLTLVSFAGVFLTLVAANAHDRLEAAESRAPEATKSTGRPLPVRPR